jgi:hypothetical protein
MAPRLLFTVFALGAAMLGCAGPQIRVVPLASECSATESKCRLEIDVTDCTRADGYTINNVDLHVTMPARIEWKINTGGYRFRQDIRGIEIWWGVGVFDQPQQHGPDKFSWRDKHRDGPAFKAGDSYYYAINVERNDGTACARFDPWITNY